MPDPVKPDPPKLKIVDGIVIDPKVKVSLCPRLDHGPLKQIHAIIMHQTASPSIGSVWNKYRSVSSTDRTGAHFLIDKDGTIYQTLAITHKCAHVAPVSSRCLAEHTCTPQENTTYSSVAKKSGAGSGTTNKAVGAIEAKKQYPARYPWNPDSIGIEVVSMADKDTGIYEDATLQQNASAHWLVPALLDALGLTTTDVYRHPTVSAKMPTEAKSVTW